MKMRKTFVNLGRQIVERTEKRERKAETQNQKLRWSMRPLKAAIIILITASSIYFSFSFWNAPTSEVSAIEKIGDASVSENAIGLSEKIYEAYRDNKFEEYKSFIKTLDMHAQKDCESVFAKLSSPDFNNASVCCPKTDKNLCFVYLPPSKSGEQVQFVLRKSAKDNSFRFEGICLNQK